MHLTEQYALSCGVKIGKPSVQSNFFPLPFEKYIILHPSSGMQAKNYDYYEDVVEILLPFFRKLNLPIVQIGGAQDPPIPGCYHLQGQTSLNQVFYLIEKCSLLLGNDSFSGHVAGGYDKNIVSLYSNLYADCCKPYWGSPERQTLIQADREGKKPSFSASENPKVVNNINPEEIARAVLTSLEIPHSLDHYNTLDIGSSYKTKIIEVIPNFLPPASFPQDKSINIRADYFLNSEILSQWVFRTKSHLIIEEPIDPNFFPPIRQNIVKITLKVTEDSDLKYVNFLKQLGVPLELFTEDSSNLYATRLKFFHWNVGDFPTRQKKDLDSPDKICDNTCYQSSKTILSNGKEYSSKAAWLEGSQKNKKQLIIDNETFWKESEFFKIYNTTENVPTKEQK